MHYDLITSGCPADFDAAALKVFEAYDGPPQARRGPPPTGERPPKGDRPPKPR